MQLLWKIYILIFFYAQFPTQSSLSEGMIPVFYHDKVPARTPGEATNAVLLSILIKVEHLMSSSHELSSFSLFLFWVFFLPILVNLYSAVIFSQFNLAK